MKTTLTFEYEWQSDDGIGTSCDALHCAVHALQTRLANADSMDDMADVFVDIRHV